MTGLSAELTAGKQSTIPEETSLGPEHIEKLRDLSHDAASSPWDSRGKHLTLQEHKRVCSPTSSSQRGELVPTRHKQQGSSPPAGQALPEGFLPDHLAEPKSHRTPARDFDSSSPQKQITSLCLSVSQLHWNGCNDELNVYSKHMMQHVL